MFSWLTCSSKPVYFRFSPAPEWPPRLHRLFLCSSWRLRSSERLIRASSRSWTQHSGASSYLNIPQLVLLFMAFIHLEEKVTRKSLSDASKGQMHSDLCCGVCVRSKCAHPLLLKLLPPLLLHRSSAELLLLSLLLQPPPALLHRPLILQPCPALLLPDQLFPGR